MKKQKGFTLIELLVIIAIVAMLIAVAVSAMGCIDVEPSKPTPKSTSGVKKATAKVKTQANGLTIEQENVKNRLEAENKPGSIKHLYIVSAYSGQAILYSTVKGKVTSSGKRLTPNTVSPQSSANFRYMGIDVGIGGERHYTSEVLQDDGTYGHSISYLFWWDVQGRYHQHYVSGGQIVHISDQPIAMKNIIINMEVSEIE